jgi:hydroxyacylglutathione hydrolase
LGEINPVPRTVSESLNYFRAGASLLDLRSREEHRVEHVPGSVHLELDDQLSNRAGFVLHPDTPILLQLSSPAGPSVTGQYRQAVYALARVGFDRVAGYLSEGLDVWKSYGLPVTAGDIREISIAEFRALLDGSEADQPTVLDVREPWEYAQGHVPGAKLIPLGRLGEHLEELDPNRPLALICQTGSRSRSAAALLGSRGFKTLYNVTDGTQGWERSGLPLERSGATVSDL